MSEESTLTKDETINQPITNTAAESGTAVNTADASNIVPFAPESSSVQTEDSAVLKTPEVPLTSAEEPVTPTELNTASSEAPTAPPEVRAAPSAVPVAPQVVPVTSPEVPVTPPVTPVVPSASPYVHYESADISGNAAGYNSKTAEPADKTDAYTDRAAGFTNKAGDFTDKAAGFTDKAADFTDKAADFTDKAAGFTDKAAGFTSKTFKKAVSHVRQSGDDEFPDDDVPEKKRFHFKKEDKEFFRDKWILSRISDENLMDYLTLEQRRNELQQEARDVKEKRIFKAFEITVGLASIVAVIYLLRDNPSILVNILYIAGILAALWFWKNPREK